MAAANDSRAGQLAMQKAYGPANMLPPSDNTELLRSALSLYNPTLFIASQALLQHTLILALIFLLRGFSTKRVLDLHFLTIAFATTMIAAPLIFLIDTRVDRLKLLFFLEHEAVEVLIAVRVMAPANLVARRPGLIILLLYCLLVGMSIPVIMNDFVSHSAIIVAWGAFVSDSLLATSGILLIKKWWMDRRGESGRAVKQKQQAEAISGLGFMLHGFVTLSIGPIFTLVIYNGLDPGWFAYGWVAVWLSGFFAIAFAVPSACLFFANIWWCCGSRRPIYPGQVEWQEERLQEKPRYNISHSFRHPDASGSSVDGYQVEAMPIGTQCVRSGMEWDALAKA